jgi:hypothetical protein
MNTNILIVCTCNNILTDENIVNEDSENNTIALFCNKCESSYSLQKKNNILGTKVDLHIVGTSEPTEEEPKNLQYQLSDPESDEPENEVVKNVKEIYEGASLEEDNLTSEDEKESTEEEVIPEPIEDTEEDESDDSEIQEVYDILNILLNDYDTYEIDSENILELISNNCKFFVKNVMDTIELNIPEILVPESTKLYLDIKDEKERNDKIDEITISTNNDNIDNFIKYINHMKKVINETIETKIINNISLIKEALSENKIDLHLIKNGEIILEDSLENQVIDVISLSCNQLIKMEITKLISIVYNKFKIISLTKENKKYLLYVLNTLFSDYTDEFNEIIISIFYSSIKDVVQEQMENDNHEGNVDETNNLINGFSFDKYEEEIRENEMEIYSIVKELIDNNQIYAHVFKENYDPERNVNSLVRRMCEIIFPMLDEVEAMDNISVDNEKGIVKDNLKNQFDKAVALYGTIIEKVHEEIPDNKLFEQLYIAFNKIEESI